ncbi:MAG: folate family ECF transporter S component [Oscillospiraceae bacterium]|nr:folate family ECF transporter S component [Oscillospiraceae bacterium]
MKSFFNLFIDSAKSLKNLRTLATTGMLLAMAIAIRSLAIQVTPDLRIVFTCIPISLIGLLYGPVVCGMSTFALDIIGFLIDNKSARGYSIELAMVVILSGIIYGIFLYKQTIKPQWSDLLRVALARFCVIFICNICLNSYFLYTLYVNPDFTLLGATEDMRNAFSLWITPRVIKNLGQFPIDFVLLAAVIPAAQAAYTKVRAQYSHNDRKQISER